MPDPNTLPLVRIADTSGNPANPGGGSGTANPYPGSDYAKDTKQPVLVNGRVPIDGSQVTQPVSGTFFQTTQPISAASLPLPTGAAADGSDPASPAVANAGAGIRGWLATIAGLLKLGTQTKAQSGSVTIATDQGNLEPGGTAITGTAMPTGGVGLTGWLSAIWQGSTQRTVLFADVTNASLAAAASTADSRHALGAAPVPYTKFNAAFLSTQSGNYYVQGSNDNFVSVVTTATGTITAGTPVIVSTPVIFATYRAFITNGTTAGTATVATSFTAA